MQYLDLFGGITEHVEPVKETNRRKTMQELYGTIQSETCRTCGNLLKFGYHGKAYYKCNKWKISHGIATDIRLKTQACGKWVPGKEGE